MSTEMITLATLSHSRAQLLKAMLASEGVESFLTNIHRIQGSAPAARVKIHEKDIPLAMKIMRSMEQEYGPDEVEQEHQETTDRILVPVDFSPASDKAAELSVSLAQRTGADIKLFHAYFNPALGMTPFNETLTYQDVAVSHLRDLHMNAKTRLLEMTKEVRERVKSKNLDQVDVNYYLTMGEPASEIIRISKQYKPNVIVMPIGHTETTDNSLISSVTANVIDNSDYPTLAIPENFTNPTLENIDNILYITTYDQRELKAVKNLMRLLAPLKNASVHVLHIYEDENPAAAEYQMEQLRKFFTRYTKVTFTGKNLQCKSKDSVKNINNYIEENQIHILSLVNYKQNLISRLLYPGIARKMVFHSKTPLLVFPGGKR